MRVRHRFRLSMTWAGLTVCYVAAIPFFRSNLLGDLGFPVLFGGFALVETSSTVLQEKRDVSAFAH